MELENIIMRKDTKTERPKQQVSSLHVHLSSASVVVIITQSHYNIQKSKTEPCGTIWC